MTKCDVKTAAATFSTYFRDGITETTPVSVLSKLAIAASALGRADAVRFLIPNQIRVLRRERETAYRGGAVLANRMTLREGPQALDAQRLGRAAEALHLALLQSAPPNPGGDPVIRVFPSWPEEWNASYTLLARGAFLVTSSIDRGRIGFVVRENASFALDLLGLALPVVPSDIPVIDFGPAQRMIEADTGRATVGEPDLSPADERWLGDWAARQHLSEFLFVTGYPMAKRPFYAHPRPDDTTVSNSFDLLFRGLELVTGGQRLHRYEDYVDALDGSDLKPFEGYLEAFRHGMPPHGGFAIGLERWVARLTGAANIREVTLFPRDLHRLTP